MGPQSQEATPTAMQRAARNCPRPRSPTLAPRLSRPSTNNGPPLLQRVLRRGEVRLVHVHPDHRRGRELRPDCQREVADAAADVEDTRRAARRVGADLGDEVEPAGGVHLQHARVAARHALLQPQLHLAPADAAAADEALLQHARRLPSAEGSGFAAAGTQGTQDRVGRWLAGCRGSAVVRSRVRWRVPKPVGAGSAARATYWDDSAFTGDHGRRPRWPSVHPAWKSAWKSVTVSECVGPRMT